MNEVQIVSQLAAGLPFPPLPMDAGLPPGLDSICEQALHPNPQYRYQTAAEMEEDLERVLIGSEDSHARNLGRVVSLAFAAERAERQGLIEASSRLEVGADIPMAPPPRDAEVEATPPGRARAAADTPAQPIVARGDAGAGDAGAAMPRRRCRGRRRRSLTGDRRASTECPLADTRARPRRRPRRPRAATCRRAEFSSRGRRVWLRRTVVVAGLMAIAALLVRFDGGAKRLVFIGHVAAPAAVAQPLSRRRPPPRPPP